MHIIQIGLNHRTANVEIRERLAISESDVPIALSALCSENGHHPAQAREAVILSTCNRLEIYAVVDDVEAGFRETENQLAHVTGVDRAVFEPHLEQRQGEVAVAHLCDVACGLDSMVLGESQIQGQIAAAYDLARDHGTTGAVINSLFRTALHAGKRARTETAVNKHSTSVSHAAVDLASQIFQDLSNNRALLVGAGETAELAAKYLIDNGVGDILVVNRSPGRAASLAQRFGGDALDWHKLTQALRQADIVISSTAARCAVLTRDTVATAMDTRRYRPLIIIDIAVPRDVEPSVAQLHNVFLYDIDDLMQVVDANLEQRRREVPHVQAIIRAEVADFMAWYRSLDVVPTLVDLRRHAESIREAEIDRALRRLDHLSAQERSVISALSRRIVNRILHEPTVRLKAQANGREGDRYAHVVRDLFGLDDTDVGLDTEGPQSLG
jgi:glutamyl-tRNA reductase